MTRSDQSSTDKSNQSEEPIKTKEHRCYLFKEIGHLQQDCPTRKEAPARSITNGTELNSRTGVVASNVRPEDLTESQLEQLLAEQRVARDESILPPESSTNSTIHVNSSGQAGTVGPRGQNRRYANCCSFGPQCSVDDHF